MRKRFLSLLPATLSAGENANSKGLPHSSSVSIFRVSAVVAEELWWQAIDFARLNHSTISFFNFQKPESTASRWNRISFNASKVGKGLSLDVKAHKLAFQHWIEAMIDSTKDNVYKRLQPTICSGVCSGAWIVGVAICFFLVASVFSSRRSRGSRS